MGGKFSRSKGIRGELALRDYLRERGYDAFRVPLSGASEGYKGDVVASKDGKIITFELKCRKESYTKIYELVREVFGGIMNSSRSQLMVVSDRWEDIDRAVEGVFIHHPKYDKTLNKLVKMKELLGTADILVLKDDRKPFLFVRYL